MSKPVQVCPACQFVRRKKKEILKKDFQRTYIRPYDMLFYLHSKKNRHFSKDGGITNE